MKALVGGHELEVRGLLVLGRPQVARSLEAHAMFGPSLYAGASLQICGWSLKV